jgi:hypothetical protein
VQWFPESTERQAQSDVNPYGVQLYVTISNVARGQLSSHELLNTLLHCSRCAVSSMNERTRRTATYGCGGTNDRVSGAAWRASAAASCLSRSSAISTRFDPLCAQCDEESRLTAYEVCQSFKEHGIGLLEVGRACRLSQL